MKRVLAFLITLLMLLPLCACSSSLPQEQSSETKTEEKAQKTEEKTEEPVDDEPLPTDEIVYPDTFSVGYNRQSIAPEVFPIPTYSTYGHEGKSNHDPVQLTCTAPWDGKRHSGPL